MIVKGTKQVGSFKRGMNFSISKKTAFINPTSFPILDQINIKTINIYNDISSENYFKKSILLEYLGQPGPSLNAYLTAGFVYVSAVGFDILVPPNATIGNTPNPGDNSWFGPYPDWKFAQLYSDEGFDYIINANNNSASIDAIPTTGWNFSDNYFGIKGISITRT